MSLSCTEPWFTSRNVCVSSFSQFSPESLRGTLILPVLNANTVPDLEELKYQFGLAEAATDQAGADLETSRSMSLTYAQRFTLACAYFF